MRTIALVAPFVMPNTLRYVTALTAIDGIRPAIISADPLSRFPPALRERFAAFEQVRDCFDSKELARAAKAIAARTGSVDRLLGVLEQLQMPVAEARDLAGIPGMGRAIVERFRDKSVMKRVLREHGVPCARHARVEHADDARRFVESVGFPVIVKPVDGLGTRSTVRVTDAQGLETALASMRPSPGNVWQIEEFLLGSEHSFETVTIAGKHIWSSATNYIPGPLEVMETPWIQYCVVLPRETDLLDRFRAVNHAALTALGMETGLSHMEWFTRHDGSLAVNEVGARPPGVNIMPMMGLAHGIDFVAAWVRLMALDTFEPPTRVRAAGSAFLRGQGAGRRVAAVHGVQKVMEEVGRHVAIANLPEIGQARAEGYEGEGNIVVAADTTAEVMHALGRIIRTIRITYA